MGESLLTPAPVAFITHNHSDPAEEACPEPKRDDPRNLTNEHEPISCGLRFALFRVISWIVTLGCGNEVFCFFLIDYVHKLQTEPPAPGLE